MNQISAHLAQLQRRIHLFCVTRANMHDAGQATTEYALVLLGAAIIALLVVAWATDGGGAGRIGELFDSVIGNILGRADAIQP
jgi:hypothetical protein